MFQLITEIYTFSILKQNMLLLIYINIKWRNSKGGFWKLTCIVLATITSFDCWSKYNKNSLVMKNDILVLFSYFFPMEITLFSNFLNVNSVILITFTLLFNVTL